MANGALGFSSSSNLPLTDRFEIIKEVGDGSFGSVVLAKVRSAGSSVAKRGSVVCHIKVCPHVDSINHILYVGCNQDNEENV
jgi:hypothetical protein